MRSTFAVSATSFRIIYNNVDVVDIASRVPSALMCVDIQDIAIFDVYEGKS